MLHGRHPGEFSEGDRVRAVAFVLDPGQRIWPLQLDDCNVWRVVDVYGPDPDDYTELFKGGQTECQERYPGATFSINDNESVPPGTEGTVDFADASNLAVRWDNGRRLGVRDRDRIEKV